MQSVELLQTEKVEFNILCVLNQANVEKPRELYRFFKGLGVDNIQFIPLAEFDAGRQSRCRSRLRREQYGRFLCEMFELWWPDRRKMRIRFFDNIAEALAGQKPGNCTMHETLRQLRGGGVQRRRLPVRFFRGERLEAGERHAGFVERNCAAHATLLASPRRRRWRTRSARCANTSRSAMADVPSSATGRTEASRIWIISARRIR